MLVVPDGFQLDQRFKQHAAEEHWALVIRIHTNLGDTRKCDFCVAIFTYRKPLIEHLAFSSPRHVLTMLNTPSCCLVERREENDQLASETVETCLKGHPEGPAMQIQRPSRTRCCSSAGWT
eukprot:8191818-Pyramimonas_sp.AAC.1